MLVGKIMTIWKLAVSTSMVPLSSRRYSKIERVTEEELSSGRVDRYRTHEVLGHILERRLMAVLANISRNASTTRSYR